MLKNQTVNREVEWKCIPPRLFYVLITVIFIIGFVARVEFARRNGFFQNNVAENMRVAVSLVKGQGFAGPFPNTDGIPSAHISPVFPFLLSVLYRIVGLPPKLSACIGQSVFSILLDLLNALLAYVITVKIYRQSMFAGLIACSFMILNPYFLWFTTEGAHETVLLGILLQLLLLLTVIVHRENWKRVRTIFFLGIISGISALTTPAFLLYMSLFWLYELHSHFRNREVRLKIGLTVIMTCMIVLPWGLRNQQKLGGFVMSRSNLGLELYIGNNKWANGETYQNNVYVGKLRVFDYLHPWSNPDEQKLYRKLGELKYMALKKNVALAWIKSNFGKFLLLCVHRAAFFWLPLRTQSFYEYSKSIYHWALLILFALYSIRALGRKDEEAIMGLALVSCFFLPYLVTHINLRYKFPIISVLVIGSVCQIFYWIDQYLSPRIGAFARLPKRKA